MKEKISAFVGYLKFFIMVFTMTLGFFITYVFVLVATDLPVGDWTFVILMALSILSEVGFIMWCKR